MGLICLQWLTTSNRLQRHSTCTKISLRLSRFIDIWGGGHLCWPILVVTRLVFVLLFNCTWMKLLRSASVVHETHYLLLTWTAMWTEVLFEVIFTYPICSRPFWLSVWFCTLWMSVFLRGTRNTIVFRWQNNGIVALYSYQLRTCQRCQHLIRVYPSC